MQRNRSWVSTTRPPSLLPPQLSGTIVYICSVIPWSPVARGALAKPRSATSLRSETDPILAMLVTNQQRDSEKEIIDRVEALAKKRGVSMAQIATAWILSKDGIRLI